MTTMDREETARLLHQMVDKYLEAVENGPGFQEPLEADPVHDFLVFVVCAEEYGSRLGIRARLVLNALVLPF